MNLRDIYHRFIAGEKVHNAANTITKTEQKQFADTLPADKDDYSLSYNKYLCRKFMDFSNGNFTLFCINLVSAVIFLPIWVLFSIRGIFRSNKNRRTVDALVIKPSAFSSIDDILPLEHIQSYGDHECVEQVGSLGGILDKKAHAVMRQSIVQHPFSFYYQLLLMINLGKYCKFLSTYKTKAVYSFADERSPVNPLITYYCEGQNVDHIGFMHGEVYYQIDKGFLRYTEYLVWDLFYQQLFADMYCNCTIRNYRPHKLQLEQCTAANPEYYLTYYDSENSVESLKHISEIFQMLEKQGKKCQLRPHPRFSNIEAINSLFPSEMIQSGREVSIADSFRQTEYVASICSTVLIEAFYSGKEIVIDDMTDTERFNNIADKDYIMLTKQHIVLSTIIKRRDALDEDIDLCSKDI